MIPVILTWSEVFQAGLMALMRTLKNLQNGVAERYGAEGDSLDYNFRGCIGELALAKYRNTFWSGNLGDYKAIDVGGRWQVRSAGRSDGRLILHPQDSDDEPFVLALVVSRSLPTVMLRGWVTGAEGKLLHFWLDPGTGRPAFFVPQDILHDMADLAGDRYS